VKSAGDLTDAAAQQLSARFQRVLALQQRLLPDAASYRLGARALWPFTAVGIVLLGLLPYYASENQVLIVQQAMYLGLLALSLNLLVETTGLISFGHAMFYGFGAYMVAVPFAAAQGLPNQYHLDLGPFKHPLYALMLTPVIGALAAFVIGLLVLRGKALYFSLLTLGVGQLIWATAHGWQKLTGGTNGLTGVFAASWLNPFTHPNNLYWFIFGVTLLCTALLYVITNSPFGDACRAIRENRRRAEFTGLWVKRYELTAIVIAGTFGAVAGGLQVIGDTQIGSGQIDWQRSAIALIVVLIGGMRYFLGPIAGAIFWLFLFDWLTNHHAPNSLWNVFYDTILGCIALAVALLFPGGLVGALHLTFAYGASLGRRILGKPALAPPIEVALAAAGDGQEEVHLPSLTELRLEEPVAAGPNGAGPPVLEIEGVSKAFGGLVAVDDVTLSVRKGAIHAIIGPNGAGKTTLFNLITGLMSPDSGRVTLEGEDVTGKPAWLLVKRGLGRSFQTTSLFWSLSSLMNVTLSGSAVKDGTRKLYGGHPKGIREHAGKLLERMGLADFAELPAIHLSHGDQRSLEVATALAVESRLLLLDEPTAGLAPSETKAAVELIKRIAREQQLTVLFVEHDMEVVFRIADRITVLHKGAVLAEGTPEEIRRNEKVKEAYLGAEVVEAGAV
jgi:ABC-type branched-subunit amino acid transport system ATPase component/ABC-type branched-subunit amino acid transport system permease subunit